MMRLGFQMFDYGFRQTGICQDTSKKLVRSLFTPEEPQQGLCPLRFATPGYFLNMNRRFLVLCFVYYARAIQGGIPMTANVNRAGSVRLRGAISLSG